jgi:hypothetical protein
MDKPEAVVTAQWVQFARPGSIRLATRTVVLVGQDLAAQ